MSTEPVILVHPDRWDAFQAAIAGRTVTTVSAEKPETGANCLLPYKTEGRDSEG